MGKPLIYSADDISEIINNIDIPLFDRNGENIIFTKYILIRKNIYPIVRMFYPNIVFNNIENILRLKIHPAMINFNFYCDEIIIKNNIRIQNYNKDRISIKIHVNEKNEDFYNEIRANSVLKNIFGDTIITPTLIDYDKYNRKWLVERYIENTNTINNADIFYILNNIIDVMYRKTVYFDYLKAKDEMLIQRYSYDLVENIMTKISSPVHQKFTYAFCHGDLTESNFIKDKNGKIFITDWEHAGNNPIAFDLAKLFMNNPEVRDDIIKLVDSTSDAEDTASANIQMALGIQYHLNKIIDSAKNLLNNKQRKIEESGREIIVKLLEKSYSFIFGIELLDIVFI